MMFFNINVIFYQVKMLIFCNVQTTTSTYIGKTKWDV